GCRLAAYSCGGSRRLCPEASRRSLFASFRRTGNGQCVSRSLGVRQLADEGAHMHCRAYALPFRRLARGFAFRPHKLDYFPIMRPLKQRCGPLAWGLAIALLFGAVATPATGRVVAVVIDDSASMNSGSRSPFTVHLLQLTAAVLNEHEDRLFVRRLSEHISEKSDLRQDVLLA